MFKNSTHKVQNVEKLLNKICQSINFVKKNFQNFLACEIFATNLVLLQSVFSKVIQYIFH